MKVAGSFDFDAPRAEVFRAICDPGTLLAIIPGADSIEQVGPDEYRGRITLRLPGIVGSYGTTVRLVDATPPERAGMAGRLEGTLGTVAGRADFTLAEAGAGSRLDYHGPARIDGPLARLDSRFAERLAQSLIAQGLQSLNLRLSRAAVQAAPAGPRPTTEVAE